MSSLKFVVSSVIFDMDGVITNTMPDHFRSWKQVLVKRGINVSHLDIYEREGQPGIQSVKELFEKYGRSYDLAEARSILKEKEELFKRIVKVRFIHGARRFINSLMRERFKLALVTGTSHHEMERILPEEVRAKFAVIVTGDQVKNGKPHPEPFLLSLERLKIPAEECVVIENAPFGILSAKRAGLRCLALATSLPGGYLREAHSVFLDYNDLNKRASFHRLNGKALAVKL